MIHLRKRRIFCALCIIFIALFIIACATEVRKPVSQLDTPEHHVATGMKFMNQGKFTEAQREFELAFQLSPKFSMAHAGLGIVKASQGDYKAAFEAMKTASKYANSNEEKVFVHVGYIRLYTMRKQDNKWLKDALSAYGSAIAINPKSAAAHYYMGVAYKMGLEFQTAGQMFTKVLDLNTAFVQEADQEWKLVQKIQRAVPGSVTGKKIAIVESINRADAAALLMEELNVDRLYEKRTVRTSDSSFKDPEKFGVEKFAKKRTANDINTNPLRGDIESILSIGVRGLENYPDGAFHPAELVTRATFAMMIEDIIIKVTGDQRLATKFIGSTSPFPDLRPDLPYFNAVMVVTSRGIMEAKDVTNGEFAPLAPVSGADALLVIRKIKEELRF
jgi:tetratricopeptide (TPR) repeat protein